MVGDMMTIKQKAKGKRQKWGGNARQSVGVLRPTLAFCLFFLFALPAGAADTLRDPTRPPADLTQGNAGVPVASGPELQSVRISAHQRSAMISGQRVKVGDKLGDARIVMITENEVVLKGSSGLQTLKLFPDVSKRIILRSQHPKH